MPGDRVRDKRKRRQAVLECLKEFTAEKLKECLEDHSGIAGDQHDDLLRPGHDAFTALKNV